MACVHDVGHNNGVSDCEFYSVGHLFDLCEPDLLQGTIFCASLFVIASARPLRPRDLNQVFSGSQADAINVFDGVGRGSDVYRQYTGNGDIGWPTMSEWVSFQQMYVIVAMVVDKCSRTRRDDLGYDLLDY